MLSIASGELPPQQTLPAGTRRLLAKRVPKGVPDPLRGTVWCALSGAQALMDERPGAYAALKRRARQKAEALREKRKAAAGSSSHFPLFPSPPPRSEVRRGLRKGTAEYT